MINNTTTHYQFPLPNIANTLAEDVERLEDALIAVDTEIDVVGAQIGESAYLMPAITSVTRYFAGGNVQDIVDTLNDDRTRTTSFTYDLDRVATETVDIGNVRRVTTYAYDGAGRVVGWDTVESAI